ncbi:MAG: hypothetical protein HY530_05625 [Chloroflexi bacterium]|nr:hypothetical protein [Chloroflexota bacterium]
MVKIGIPRALLYYQYYPMWKSFFENLGAEVVVSPPTTQAALASGSSRVVADTCLPVKAFLGHVLALADECDYIFIPAIRSMKPKIYTCSKFLGLPDMTRAVIPGCPPILDIDIDMSKSKRKLYQAIYRLGRHFTWGPFKVRRAAVAAWQAYLDYRRMMSSQRLTSVEAIDRLSGPPAIVPVRRAGSHAVERQPEQPPPRMTIAVIGHPYIFYDELISHRIKQRLEQAGCRVLTPQMLTGDELEAATARLVGRAYWTYEEEVVGAGEHYLTGGVDGVIGLMTFGCGPDSLMMDVLKRRAAAAAAPFMSLTVEEHTSDAGIITRLEAFIDMIMIRRRARRAPQTCA